MVLSGESEEGDEERRQFLEMLHMVKDSNAMISKARKSALKKTEQAMEEVMSIDKDADKEIEKAQKQVEEAKAKIARAKAASAKSMLTKQRAQKVLAAAVREAKLFKTILMPKKQQKAKKTDEQSSSLASEANPPVAETKTETAQASEASDIENDTEEVKASETSSQDIEKNNKKVDASEAFVHAVEKDNEKVDPSKALSQDIEKNNKKVDASEAFIHAVEKDKEKRNKKEHHEMEQAASRVIKVAASAKKLATAEKRLHKHADSEKKDKFDQWMMDELDAQL